MERGCLAFLDHLCDTSIKVPSILSVLVVCEFFEVFPDLPGIPPNCDIDFSIDLEPETCPISIMSYQMALIS